MTKALEIAVTLESDWCDKNTILEASQELRNLNDLLGKANALSRIRGDRIKELEAEIEKLKEALREVSMDKRLVELMDAEVLDFILKRNGF